MQHLFGVEQQEDMSHWLPLESNPDVMNKFIQGLGVQSGFAYTDVWGLDEELLATVPQPVAAVILLFPVSEAYIQYRNETEPDSEDEEDATTDAAASADVPDAKPTTEAPATTEAAATDASSLFFMKQTIGNACGTIGIIHSIANNLDKIKLADDGFMKKFLDKALLVSPDERASLLEQDEEICVVHEAVAQEGQTAPPEPEELVNLHFICFVNNNNTLYQLDGCREAPISHGATTADTFLADTAKIVQEFMARDPEEMRFTVIALSKEAAE